MHSGQRSKKIIERDSQVNHTICFEKKKKKKKGYPVMIQMLPGMSMQNRLLIFNLLLKCSYLHSCDCKSFPSQHATHHALALEDGDIQMLNKLFSGIPTCYFQEGGEKINKRTKKALKKHSSLSSLCIIQQKN